MITILCETGATFEIPDWGLEPAEWYKQTPGCVIASVTLPKSIANDNDDIREVIGYTCTTEEAEYKILKVERFCTPSVSNLGLLLQEVKE